jgi:hypothetical protein
MNENHIKTFADAEDGPQTKIGVNVVHYDDQDQITHSETMPLAHYMNDYGQTSESYLAIHQKLSARQS